MDVGDIELFSPPLVGGQELVFQGPQHLFSLLSKLRVHKDQLDHTIFAETPQGFVQVFLAKHEAILVHNFLLPHLSSKVFDQQMASQRRWWVPYSLCALHLGWATQRKRNTLVIGIHVFMTCVGRMSDD